MFVCPIHVDDPLAAKIRSHLKKRGIDFDAPSSYTAPESDSMRKKVVNTCNSIFIPCVSSYEKPVVKIMSLDDSVNAHVCSLIGTHS